MNYYLICSEIKYKTHRQNIQQEGNKMQTEEWTKDLNRQFSEETHKWPTNI